MNLLVSPPPSFFWTICDFYQSSYHCKVMNIVDDFNNNNIVSGKGPEFKWQKKVYICLLQET